MLLPNSEKINPKSTLNGKSLSWCTVTCVPQQLYYTLSCHLGVFGFNLLVLSSSLESSIGGPVPDIM